MRKTYCCFCGQLRTIDDSIRTIIMRCPKCKNLFVMKINGEVIKTTYPELGIEAVSGSPEVIDAS
ncbi:MAG: hypothetical protein FWD58_02075 [Firmicutes bacterium]|nr:hypothetical protein [Bacillota bacterium]